VSLQNCEIIPLGSDCKGITLDEYMYSWGLTRGITPENALECQVKYSIIQLADLNHEKEFDYIVICNGIYEAKYILSIINQDKEQIIKNSKLIVWTPIDYIPTYECVKELFTCDCLITMTSVMCDILKNLNNDNRLIIDWVGHGSELNGESSNANVSTSTNASMNRQLLIKKLNAKHNVLFMSKNLLNVDDIIILNANNCVDRKRLDLTLKIFERLLNGANTSPDLKKRLKLWLHTDIKKLNGYLEKLGITMKGISNNIILSNNTTDNETLRDIYTVCRYGLQTSTGEGWSLTNCEHVLYNPSSIQFVPNFLATGLNFSNTDSGVLLPIKPTRSKSEENLDIIIGVVDPVECSKIILETINAGVVPKPEGVFKGPTWEESYERFKTIITPPPKHSA
jgi:hypothetical protein